MSNENENNRNVYGRFLDILHLPLDRNIAEELTNFLNNMPSGEKFLYKIEGLIDKQETNSVKLDELTQSVKELRKSVDDAGKVISNLERTSVTIDKMLQSIKNLEETVNHSQEIISKKLEITDMRILDQYKIIDGKHEEFKQWVSNNVWWFIWIIGLCYGIWHYFIR